MIFDDPDVRMRPKPKRVHDYDHDMERTEIPAHALAAGDLVPGLGVLDAILAPLCGGELVLCHGEDARIVGWADLVDVFPAMCKVCAMHPIDCDFYGCDTPRADF